MLTNNEIYEYETLLQRQTDGDTLSNLEQDRLYQLEQKADSGTRVGNDDDYPPLTPGGRFGWLRTYEG